MNIKIQVGHRLKIFNFFAALMLYYCNTILQGQVSLSDEGDYFLEQESHRQAHFSSHPRTRIDSVGSMKVWTSVSSGLEYSLSQRNIDLSSADTDTFSQHLDNILEANEDVPYRDLGAYDLIKSSKFCGDIYLLKNEYKADDPSVIAKIRNEKKNAKLVEIHPGINLVHKRNLEEKISFAYSIYRFDHFEKRRSFYLDQKTLLDYHVVDMEPEKDLTVDICDKKITKYDRKIRELDLKLKKYFNYKTPTAKVFVNRQMGTVSEEEVMQILDERLADYLHSIALERFEVNTKLARAISNPKVERYLQQVAKQVFDNDDEDPIIRIHKFLGLFPSLEFTISNDPNTDMKPLLCRHLKKVHKLSRIRRRLRNALIPISMVTACSIAPGIGAGIVYGMLIAGGVVSITSGAAEAWLTWQAMQKRVHIKKQSKLLYKIYAKTNKVVDELKEKADHFESLSPADQKDLHNILKMEEDMDMRRTNEVKQLYREDLLNRYLLVMAAGKIVTGPLNFVGGAAVVFGRLLTPILLRRPV